MICKKKTFFFFFQSPSLCYYGNPRKLIFRDWFYFIFCVHCPLMPFSWHYESLEKEVLLSSLPLPLLTTMTRSPHRQCHPSNESSFLYFLFQVWSRYQVILSLAYFVSICEVPRNSQIQDSHGKSSIDWRYHQLLGKAKWKGRRSLHF